MYLRTCSNSKPTVDTAYPRAQKCSPVKFRSLPHKQAIAMALFPFRNPITKATGYFGGIAMHILLFLALTKPRGMLCPNGTVKPFLVSLVEPVAYLNLSYFEKRRLGQHRGGPPSRRVVFRHFTRILSVDVIQPTTNMSLTLRTEAHWDQFIRLGPSWDQKPQFCCRIQLV